MSLPARRHDERSKVGVFTTAPQEQRESCVALPRVAHEKAQSKSRFPQSVDRALPHAMAEPLRTLEFFSGIGGLHYALRDTRIPHKVLKSYDVDDAAVKTYRHNMPDTPVSTQNISSLKAAELPRAD